MTDKTRKFAVFLTHMFRRAGASIGDGLTHAEHSKLASIAYEIGDKQLIGLSDKDLKRMWPLKNRDIKIIDDVIAGIRTGIESMR